LRNVLGIGAPIGSFDERILLAELFHDRSRRLAHDQRRVKDDLTLLHGALNQLLLPIRPLVEKDVLRTLRRSRSRMQHDGERRRQA
jgi:hypothetical protein